MSFESVSSNELKTTPDLSMPEHNHPDTTVIQHATVIVKSWKAPIAL